MAQGAVLRRFVEAIHHRGPELGAARETVVDALGHAAMVDAAAVCANFHMATRIADGTGTPLDEASVDASADLRAEMSLDEMTSSRLPS